MTLAAEKTIAVEGIRIPDSSLAREITELVRDTESALLFHHSSRVYYWGALAGKRRSLKFDRELLYAGAMFHDMGLTPAHCSAHSPPVKSAGSQNSRRQSAFGVPGCTACMRTPSPSMPCCSSKRRKWVCAVSERVSIVSILGHCSCN